MNDRVTVSIQDGVADVRLNRPDKMNALDQAMFDALIETGVSLKTRHGVRAVVLRRLGQAWSHLAPVLRSGVATLRQRGEKC